jgi:hypothetical protein
MTPLKITTLEQLKKEADGWGHDFFIRLNGGLRSSIFISWHKEKKVFYVCNMIDGTEQRLTEERIMDHKRTTIGYAMTRGALYKG